MSAAPPVQKVSMAGGRTLRLRSAAQPRRAPCARSWSSPAWVRINCATFC